jgi:hypothetical protein
MSLKGKQMFTVDSCTSADADRLLGLADQTLEEWAEDAVQGGEPDLDYKQRSAEWSAIRPLLVSAPALLRTLKQIASVCRGSTAPMAVLCAAIVQAALAGLVEDDLTSQPPSNPDEARSERAYPEAAGKIVDSIRYVDETSGWPAFEIRFKDDTFLFIEPLPRVQFHMRYLKSSGGELETVRDYGIVS